MSAKELMAKEQLLGSAAIPGHGETIGPQHYSPVAVAPKTLCSRDQASV
jgi:hypothetical protein